MVIVEGGWNKFFYAVYLEVGRPIYAKSGPKLSVGLVRANSVSAFGPAA